MLQFDIDLPIRLQDRTKYPSHEAEDWFRKVDQLLQVREAVLAYRPPLYGWRFCKIRADGAGEMSWLCILAGLLWAGVYHGGYIDDDCC